jgi:RNA polymerase sigma-54 factor
MRPRLDLKLTQRLVMTPQLQQAIKLLQLTRLELTQAISLQLMENPLLEELTAEPSDDASPDTGDTGDAGETGGERGEVVDAPAAEAAKDDDHDADNPFDLDWGGLEDELHVEWRDTEPTDSAVDERPSYEQTLTKSATLIAHLEWQLSVSGLDPAEKEIGAQIIGNLDDDGYLQVAVGDIAAETHAPLEQVERVLRHIQSFDPTGIGARTLQECLQLQLEVLGLRDSVVDTLIVHHLEELERRDYAAIARQLGCTEHEVAQAAQVIERLEPKPGRPFASTDNQLIIPDVFIIKLEGEQEYRVMLNDEGLPRLRVNDYYRRLLKRQSELAKPARTYLEERYRAALWFIRSIEQRNRTITRVTESIVKFQREFFDRGLQALKPLVLRQVAEDVSLHESTISRVTANKYAQTPQGLLELKYFFNGGIASTVDGEDALSRVIVRDMIRKMIAGEDPGRPLRDEEITARLRAQHLNIARRTIAKYRAVLHIPSAGKRKRVAS